MLKQVPEIPIKDLIEIINILPNPSTVNLDLFGNFDYSNIQKQMEEVVQGTSTSIIREVPSFGIQNPTTNILKKILETSEKIFEDMSFEKRIGFKEAVWLLESEKEVTNSYDCKLMIKISPWRIYIEHRAGDSTVFDYIISEIRKRNVELEVKYFKKNFVLKETKTTSTSTNNDNFGIRYGCYNIEPNN